MDKRTGFAEIDGARIYYEVAGAGHPLVLIHAGIADSRMWDDQFDAFAERHLAVRYDVRGFGKSDIPRGPSTTRGDLHALLKFLNIDKTFLLGLSMGGGIAIDFTLEHPKMVDALIPVASGLSGYTKPSPEVEPLGAKLDAAYKGGDLAKAVAISLQIWTAGPSRTLDQVNPTVRERIREMTMHTFALPEGDRPQPLNPPALSRLAEIHVPTLVIIGDKDVSGILEIANLLEAGINGARKVVIADTAHMLNMEKPAEFNRVVLEFLKTI